MAANPITLLLGAGASFPFGIPMMGGFYETFREYLGRRHPHCFNFLERLEQTGNRPTRDLETLLSDLNAVVGLDRGLTLLGDHAATHQPDLELARELRGYLDAFIVDTCERFARDASARELTALLGLRELGPVWVFTTNYDRIVEYACEQGGISWTDGFDCPGGQAVADWTGTFETDVRIVKLHGSVNWFVDDPDGSLHRLDRGYSLPAYDFALVRGEQRLRPLMIIPTLEKDALSAPYVELSVRFTDALRETRLLIIVGNSLRDRHIRDHIRARIENLDVLLVNPAATTGKSIFGRPERTHTIAAGFSEFLAVGAAKLQELGRFLTSTATTDPTGRTAIETFVTSVSQDTLDETVLRKDSDLYRIWAVTRSPVVVDRVQAVRDLGSRPHPAVAQRLEGLLLTDPAVHVRVACVAALARVAGNGATTTFCEALRREPEPPVQLELALALCRRPQTEQIREALRLAFARPDLSSVTRSVIEEHFAAASPL